LNLFKTWNGYDDGDPDSWCTAGAYALDLRPDGLRHKDDVPESNSTFFNALGRHPNFPTKEQRPAPRPEGTLMGECKTHGWGCASCDELRGQAADGIGPSIEMLKEIPEGCTGNGARVPSLETELVKNAGVFTQVRYTQTTGRTPTILGETPATKTGLASTSTVAAASAISDVVQTPMPAPPKMTSSKPAGAGSIVGNVGLVAAVGVAGLLAAMA
jgi:hypothetical protein